VPSMMSISERQFLFHITKSLYQGKGVILDGGTLMGASTVCFGEALKLNPAAADWTGGPPIVAIERATMSGNLTRFFNTNSIEIPSEPEGSFAAQIESYIAPVRSLVDLRIGDLVEVGRVDEPIEILFLDILKEKYLGDFATTAYFPRLIPKQSIVVHQDYFGDTLPWIREHQEALSGHFRYLGEIGPTAVFLCTKRITKADAAAALDRSDPERSLRLLAAAEQRSIDPYRRLLCALSRVGLAAELQGRKEARAILRGIRDTYAAQIVDVPFKRINWALDAAEFLCRKQWSEKTAATAALITAGHVDGSGATVSR